MPQLFIGPRLKLERAKQHISDLHARLCAFSGTDYYSLRVDTDHQTGKDSLKFEITKPLPDDIGLIIGDALHNLKSALDFAVNDIVFLKTGARSKYTKFPVQDSRDKLIATVNGGSVRKASKTIADLIVDIIKPYKGGNDAIWSLHELNILDKHILLLPVFQVSALLGVCAEDDSGRSLVDGTLIVESGKVALPFVPTTNLKITKYGKAAFAVCFDKGLPLEGQSIVPALRSLAEQVGSIIDAFETVLT